MRRAIVAMGVMLLGVGVSSVSSTAMAQEQAGRAPPAVPPNTLELKFGTGYTQGFGMIAPGVGIPSVAGAGIGFNVNVDDRISPLVSLGLEAQYQEFATENNAGSRGLAGSVGVTIHGTPAQRADPWVRVGTGYRLLWDVGPTSAPGTNNLFHGFEIVAAKIGYDLRVEQGIAFAPVIGADLQSFVWENATALSKAQFGTFVYAGLEGRFDATPTPAVRLGAKR